MLELARRKKELQDSGVDVLDFGTGDPTEATAACIRKAFQAATPEVSQYPSVAGSQELRDCFAAWFGERFGVALDATDGVMPVRGSKEAMFHLPLAFLDPSEMKNIVLFPEPGYPVMEIGSLYAAARTERYVLTADEKYLMDPGRVSEDVLDQTRIVWLSYPHNPTGTDLPDDLFAAWVAARERHGFLLCSDECYTELYFGKKPRSLLEFGMKGCLAFHSLSKRSGMTGYRSGIVAGDPDLVQQYRSCRSGMGQAMPVMTQKASVAAWSDEAHVRARRAIFAAKREVMTRGLTKLSFEVWPATSTFYLWVRVPDGESDTSFVDKLLRRGIVASPGTFFGAGNSAWFRLALVPDLAGCRKAVERIESLMSS